MRKEQGWICQDWLVPFLKNLGCFSLWDARLWIKFCSG